MGGGRYNKNTTSDFPSTPEEKIQFAKDRGLSDAEIEAIKKIVSSDQPKRIEEGKQNKHIPGTREFMQKQLENQKNGLPPPGEVICDINQLQGIVNIFHGTGRPIVDGKGNFQNKEIVVLPFAVGFADGKIPTNKISIHYSKNGTHIVPRL